MQLNKRLAYATIISAITLICSIVLPIVPCRIAPAIPNPIYKWNLCSLNPDLIERTNSIKEYFGYTTSLTDTYFLILLIMFTASMIFFYITTKKKK